MLRLLVVGYAVALATRPGDLLDYHTLSSATLSQLDWQEASRDTLKDGTEVITGSFDTGPFSTLNSKGQEQTVDSLRADVTMYLPSNSAGHSGLGMVHGGQRDDHVGGILVAESKVPVLMCGYPPDLPKKFGYAGMNGLNAVSWSAMMYKNPHNLKVTSDLLWGHFPLQLAKMDVLAITLLHRLVGQPLDSVALSGSSKGGGAAWLAAAIDPRIRVLGPWHNGAANMSAYLDSIETSWGCAFACNQGSGTGQNGTQMMVFREWLRTTPAGKAAMGTMNAADMLPDVKADFVLGAGDVGLCSMHDGHHFPLGADSAFLHTLAASRSARYSRCTSCPMCAVCPSSTWDSRGRPQLYWLLAQRLVRGVAFEAELPHVVSTSADYDEINSRVRVQASVIAGGGESTEVTLWWNSSPNRVYNSPSQPTWQSVSMSAKGSEKYESAWITIPAGKELAYFVEGVTQLPMHTTSQRVHARDSSPVSFVARAPEQHCGFVDLAV